jgi:ABC-2 type transport system ATP-binding protein
MIETRELTKTYGKLTALDRLTLTVERGELFGFLGPNGAGKTTTIQILATLLKPTSGTAVIADLDVTRAGREVRRRIGYMPDSFGVYEGLTVREYLEFFAAAYDVPPNQRERTLSDVLELTDLGTKRDEMVGGLSRGMQQRLGLARVLIHDPEVLLLDEPASGLDPRARIEVREIFRELQSMGKTTLISSHILSEIAGICTSLGIIQQGRLVASGPIQQVLAEAGVGNVVRVWIDGDAEAGASVLGELTGVARVEALEDGEIRAHMTDGVEAAHEVAALLVTRGLRLRRLESEATQIEEAYMRLTADGSDAE